MKAEEARAIALKYCKMAVNRGLDMSLEDGLRYEKHLSGLSVVSADAQEGITAFLEKRDPVFHNC